VISLFSSPSLPLSTRPHRISPPRLKPQPPSRCKLYSQPFVSQDTEEEVRYLPLLDSSLVVLNFASENTGPDSRPSPPSFLSTLSLRYPSQDTEEEVRSSLSPNSPYLPSLRILRANSLPFPSLSFESGELTSSLEGVWRVFSSFSSFFLSFYRVRR